MRKKKLIFRDNSRIGSKWNLSKDLKVIIKKRKRRNMIKTLHYQERLPLVRKFLTITCPKKELMRSMRSFSRAPWSMTPN